MLRCSSSTVRRGNHSNNQSAILTDVTGVTIPYMANIGMAWVWLTILLCTLHTVTVDIALMDNHNLMPVASSHRYGAYWDDQPLKPDMALIRIPSTVRSNRSMLESTVKCSTFTFHSN